MNAQERKVRVGHRVDEVLDEVALLRPELVVLATERHDLRPRLHPAEPSHAVAVEPCAVDERPRTKSTFVGARHHRATRLGDAHHLGTRPQLAPLLLHEIGERLSHLREINNPRARHPDGGQAGRVGLYLLELLRAYPLDLEAVLQPPLVEVLEERYLIRFGRNDDLAADFVLYPTLPAELDESPRSLLAEASLQAPRLVVDAAVYDPAVVPGLVPGPASFFLQNHEPRAGMTLQKCPRGREADDAATDHDEIEHVPSLEIVSELNYLLTIYLVLISRLLDAEPRRVYQRSGLQRDRSCEYAEMCFWVALGFATVVVSGLCVVCGSLTAGRTIGCPGAYNAPPTFRAGVASRYLLSEKGVRFNWVFILRAFVRA
jgi:hypothetical protein